MKYKTKPKNWFLKRIGKRIYRDWHKCCSVCDDVAKNGMTIYDEQHADYLACTDADFANEGFFLNYRDKK